MSPIVLSEVEVEVVTERIVAEQRLLVEMPTNVAHQSPVGLASVVLLVGIAIFLAVVMKRLKRADALQCSGHMKTHFLTTYGSVLGPSNEMFRQELERRALVKCRVISKVRTRPTKFVSLAKLWRAQQSKNRYRMYRIPEEPECEKVAFSRSLRAKWSKLLRVR